MADYDVIVIGAGNNGLAAAAILAQKGKKVLVVEKNSHVGGIASTVELFKGFKHNIGAWGIFLLQEKINQAFEMEKYGFDLIPAETAYTVFGNPNEKPFTFYTDGQRLANHILENYGPEAMNGFGKMAEFWGLYAAGMKGAMFNAPLSIGQIMDRMPSAQAQDAMRQAFYGSLSDIVEKFFEPGKFEHIRGILSVIGIDGTWLGPYSPGSGFSAAFHMTEFGSGFSWKLPRGGMGMFTEAIRRNFEAHGGKVELSCPIKKVMLEDGKAVGVITEKGEKITASVVLSNLEATSTMMKLVGAEQLPDTYAQMIKNIHYRNPFMTVFATLKELPEYTGDLESINKEKNRWMVWRTKSMEHVERCWDACKHGELPDDPCGGYYIPSVYDSSLAPEGYHSMNMYYYYFPLFAPREKHEELKERAADQLIDEITKVAPNFKNAIMDRVLMGPFDYEEKFGNTNGDFGHGTFEIGQMLNFRPVAGWSNYRTPVKNLYLCGSANHPGWGVTGIPGYNCAQEVLKDLQKK